MPETGLHIAAQGSDFQIRTQVQELRLASKTRCPHLRMKRKLVQRPVFIRYEGISGVFSLRDCSDGEPFRTFRCHILQRVDGDIRLSFEQDDLKFFDEKSLPSDFNQRTIEDLVSFRGDGEKLDSEPRMCFFQSMSDVFRLPESQKAFSGRDGDFIFQVPAPF